MRCVIGIKTRDVLCVGADIVSPAQLGVGPDKHPGMDGGDGNGDPNRVKVATDVVDLSHNVPSTIVDFVSYGEACETTLSVFRDCSAKGLDVIADLLLV